jgi:hypothetical protein
MTANDMAKVPRISTAITALSDEPVELCLIASQPDEDCQGSKICQNGVRVLFLAGEFNIFDYSQFAAIVFDTKEPVSELARRESPGALLISLELSCRLKGSDVFSTNWAT